MLDSLHELQAATSEWRDFLAEGVQGNNFFNDPSHILPRLELEPQLQPWILVLRRNGRICCIAPLFLHQTRLKLEFSVVTLASLPIRMLKTFGGQFVVAADADAASCFQIVFDRLWSRRADFGLIFLENVPVTSSLWEYAQTASNRDVRFRFFLASSSIDSDRKIVFPSTHDEFLSSLSYETRRKVRRYTRRLQNTAQVRLERITEPSQVPHFLERVDQVYRDTWQAKVNGFSSRNTPSYTKYFTQLSRAGLLRSYLLTNDDGPIAFALGHQYNGVYYFLETGYSQAWANFGPGIVLMHLFFEDLMRHEKPDLLDFIGGNQPYKQSFSNFQQGVASVYLVPPNRWRHLLSVQRLLHFVSRYAVCALTFLKLDRAARRLLYVHH